MSKSAKEIIDQSTEEKIKEAARMLFVKKGYAAVKTRDIAEESGINLALLNYYFRSKEKLFHIIMAESLQQFVHGLVPIFNDNKKSLDEKIETLVERYIDMLKMYPDLPLFILSEVRMHPQTFATKFDNEIGVSKSGFITQIQTAMKHGKVKEIHILHFLANMMGLLVFPFVAAPMLKKIAGVNDKQFNDLMEERKKMIPLWLKAMMKVK